MALTITEELTIVKGDTAPAAFSLLEIVHHAGTIQGTAFYQGHKDVSAASAEAQSYVTKYLNTARLVFLNRSDILRSLERLMIVQIGEAATDLAQVQGATDTQWANFVQNNIVEVFEMASGIEQAEKTAYDAV